MNSRSLHTELARLAALLPPEKRDTIAALQEVPVEIMKKFIPDYDASAVHPNQNKKKPRSEDTYLDIFKVSTAILGDDYKNILEEDDTLGKCSPAKILNVVATVKLADQIDLDQVAAVSWNVEYNKKQFSGLIIQTTNPKANGVVYSTGRMMITGSRHEVDSKLAAEKCMNVLREAGCNINTGESYRVQNICATAQLGHRVRISEMGSNKSENWSQIVSFSPEIFSGLVCSLDNPKVTVVCFATGTLLFSGAHREEDVHIGLERFRVLSFPYRY